MRMASQAKMYTELCAAAVTAAATAAGGSCACIWYGKSFAVNILFRYALLLHFSTILQVLLLPLNDFRFGWFICVGSCINLYHHFNLSVMHQHNIIQTTKLHTPCECECDGMFVCVNLSVRVQWAGILMLSLLAQNPIYNIASEKKMRQRKRARKKKYKFAQTPGIHLCLRFKDENPTFARTNKWLAELQRKTRKREAEMNTRSLNEQ